MKKLWTGRPALAPYVLSYWYWLLPWAAFLAFFSIALAYQLKYMASANPTLWLSLIPIAFGAFMVLGTISGMITNYRGKRYTITSTHLLAPGSSSFEQMLGTGSQRYVKIRAPDVKEPLKNIIKAELRNNWIDRLFHTDTIWTHFPSSYYKRDSELHKIVVLRHISDGKRALKLLKKK